MPPGWVTVAGCPSELYAVVQVRWAVVVAVAVAGLITDPGRFQEL